MDMAMGSEATGRSGCSNSRNEITSGHVTEEGKLWGPELCPMERGLP